MRTRRLRFFLLNRVGVDLTGERGELGAFTSSGYQPVLRVMPRWAFLVTLTILTGCGPKNEMHPPREPVLSTHANAKNTTPSIEKDRDVARETPSDSKPDQIGMASWYGSELAGHKTANGEVFDPRLFTGAHKTLPFGTWVEVRRIDTGRTVRVRINDRGPNGYAKARVIDLSRRAAEDLDIVRAGVVRVEIRVVDGP